MGVDCREWWSRGKSAKVQRRRWESESESELREQIRAVGVVADFVIICERKSSYADNFALGTSL